MKDPAFLFYSADFYEGTRTMLPEERACYIDLLIYQHQHGIIPNDTKRVLMYCNGIDKATLEATLKAKFKQTESGWINDRLQVTIDERKEYSEKQSKNGIIGQFWKKSKSILCQKDYDLLRNSLFYWSKEKLYNEIKNKEISEATLKAMLKASLKHLGNRDEDCIIVDNNVISNDVIISDNTEKKEKEKNGSKSAQTAQEQKTTELSDVFINDMETIESGMIVANLGKKSGKNAIFELDFVMESFKDLVKTWLDYKKSRGQTYKSTKSIEIFYKKLIQFSGGDLNTATEIVERAIANNWAGIFELKNNQQNGTTQRPYTKSAAELKAERDREFEARIYAKLASGNNGAGADDSLPF